VKNATEKTLRKMELEKPKTEAKFKDTNVKDCSHRFSIDDGFLKMKNHEDKITSCMNLYYSGMSLRKIQEHLQMFVLKLGFSDYIKKKVKEDYLARKITLSKAAKIAGITIWGMQRYLVENGYKSEYSIQDLEEDLALLG